MMLRMGNENRKAAHQPMKPALDTGGDCAESGPQPGAFRGGSPFFESNDNTHTTSHTGSAGSGFFTLPADRSGGTAVDLVIQDRRQQRHGLGADHG